MGLQPILHVWLNHDNDLVDLTITTQTHPPLKAGQQSEVVQTTQKHPFLTIEKGFLPVSQLKLGMHVLRADGSVGTITGWKLVPGSATMYNLEVAQDHTYTVGDGLWVVHNCENTLSDPLYRNGNASRGARVTTDPNDLRLGKEINPDTGMVEPGSGFSTSMSSSGGKYEHVLPAGTTLPEGLTLFNDKGDHVMIVPTGSMDPETYVNLVSSLPWEPVK